MGLFSGIEDANIGGNNVYFVEGQYIVEVVRAFTMKSRKKQDLAIVECLIRDSTVEQRPVGSKASWVVNMGQDAALGNIKAFVAAANGLDTSDEEKVKAEVTEDVAEFAFSDANPLVGVCLSLQCTNIKTKEKKDFTKHFWEALSPEIAEELAAQAAAKG